MVRFNFPGKVRGIEIINKSSFTVLTKQDLLCTENWSTEISEKFDSPII